MEARTHEGRIIHALTEDEYEAVVDHVEREYPEDSYGRVHPVRYTVRTLLATGMRSGEISHMAREWLITHEGMPTIEVRDRGCDCAYCRGQARRNVDRHGERPDEGDPGFEDAFRRELGSMWHPKSASGRRYLTVYDEDAWGIMQRYMEEHGDDVVSPNTIWQRVRKVGEAFDFEEPLTPHRLRHSAATRMHRNGVSVEDISGELGHASLETTKIYIQEPYTSRAARIRESMSGT